MARAARRLERERQGRRVLEAKVKTARSPSIGFIGRGCALQIARPARINCSRKYSFADGRAPPRLRRPRNRPQAIITAR
jgi:hypothetical protein